MLRFVCQKIKNRKWLNLCLLAGISLLAAIFSCHPMFEKGAANQILQTAFLDYAEEANEFPAVITRNENYEFSSDVSVQTLIDRMSAYEKKWLEYIAVDTVESSQVLMLTGNTTRSDLEDNTRFLSISCMREMEDHTEVADGASLSDCTLQEGVFPCVISETLMDTYGMVVGEKLFVYYEGKKSDKAIPFEIVGIIRQSSDQDNYWNIPLAEYNKSFFVSEETMDAILRDYTYTSITCSQQLLLNYTQIDCSEVSAYRGYLEQFQEADHALTTNFLTTLQNVEEQEKSAGFILTVLELPCVILLLLFIYMVSSRILQFEEGEIAVLRSRGVTRMQIIMLYLLQSVVLSGGGILLGMLLGYVMCKCGASTDGFLAFTEKDTSLYYFRWQMIPYGLAACVTAILFMTIPVWKRAKYTIVEQKSINRYENKKPFWQTCFLDVILAAISIYLLYNFHGQREQIALTIMEGKSIDPMIFLNASLFLFACGLVFLRLSGYFIAVVDKMGKKRWKPAVYASFLQIRRTFHRQSFLSVFLIMTISGGIFDANMARTMNENNEERIRYNVGTDIRMMDTWPMQIMMMQDGQYHWEYVEPDYEKYLELMQNGSCESVTRVIEDSRVDIGSGKKLITEGELWGIHTKEFGETASLQDGLNEEHWYYALNALAENADGVIISRNAAELLQLSVGDTMQYTRYSPIEGQKDQKIGSQKVKVCAIVDAFPGYERFRYVEEEDGRISLQEHYLIVANYAAVADSFGLTPYSVWMNKASGVSDADIAARLEEVGTRVTEWMSVTEQITKSRNSAMIQVTNGMFTMSFLISLLICSAGFLIYWIMSMKNRELLFGVYRAMGMPMRQINKMLLNEQIFGSLLPILAGGGAGALGTLLFAKLIALVYLPKEHNIALHIVGYGSDMIKLFAVILVVVLVCFIVIRRILAGMKIAEALKLGED